jgi:hypothetical protein
MGSTMTAIIEWTADSMNAYEEQIVSVTPRWDDDYLHGALFKTDKEYDFFAAIAGVRSRFNKTSLIYPRGIPGNLSIPASHYFDQYGRTDPAGWLSLSEIEASMKHLEAPLFLGPEVEIIMQFMRMLVGKFGDEHVRLVFRID